MFFWIRRTSGYRTSGERLDCAFCSELKRNVDADDVKRYGYSRYHFICPECRKPVLYRDWDNSRPYFAHTKHNPCCSRSTTSGGIMFKKVDIREYGNFPVMSTDIDHNHIFDLARAIERSGIKGADVISLSCYIHAARKGNERATIYLDNRYKNYTSKVPELEVEDVVRIAYTEGRKLYDAERYPEAMPYLQIAVDARVMGASELLRLSRNRAEIDQELSVKPIQDMEPRNIDRLRQCAKKGNVTAMRQLGLVLLDGSSAISSGVQGMKWLIYAHECGDVEASKKLAELYESGMKGVKPFIITPEIYLNSLINSSGDPYKIGKIMFDGKIVKRDVPRALGFFEKASNEGDVRGDRMLSSIYTFGDGVETSEKKAAFWRKEAERKTSEQKR